jgi:disulfide bond formation protein DsbB
MFFLTNFRALSSITVLVSIALLAAAYYFELVVGLEPCPMCMMQRIVVFVLGWIALIAAIHNPEQRFGRVSYAITAGLVSLAGVAIAIRHSWIQAYPPEDIPDCGAPLEYMLDILPFQEILTYMLTGSASCTEVSWSFLGLTMPNWMIVVFIGYSVYAFLLWRTTNQQK